jgi:cytoskeletal protein CcmA (bactofilin family)
MAAEKSGNGAPAATTVIGPTIIIRGKLKVEEDLDVKGRIEADITSQRSLRVENSGIVKANVKVKTAIISGVVVGNITADEKIEIAPDGRVVGDLLAPRIIISDGAAFRGRVDMQNFDAEKTAPKHDAATPLPAPNAPTGKHEQERSGGRASKLI